MARGSGRGGGKGKGSRKGRGSRVRRSRVSRRTSTARSRNKRAYSKSKRSVFGSKHVSNTNKKSIMTILKGLGIA